MIRLWRLQRRLFSSGKAELPTPRARPARPAPTREEIDAVAKAKRDRLAPAPSLPAKPRTHEPAGWRENLQSAFRRTPKRRRNWQQIFHDEALPLALVTAGIACVTLVVYTNFYRLVLPYGVSMLPTIYLDGECVLVNLRHRRGRGIQVGDIVSAAHPIKLGEGVMKRVIGMPGDFVLSGTPGESSTMVQVPAGHCFLAGDNIRFSRDSRLYGPIPLALVVGKATHIVWPLSRFGRLHNPMSLLEEVDAV